MAGDGGAGTLTESFFACPAGALAAAPTAALVVAVEGRAPVVRVDEASDARGVARAVEASAAGRVVRGRFAAAAVVEGAIDWRDVGLPGDERVAAVDVAGVRRAVVGFLFSSPEVTADSSGSASEAVDLEARPARRTAEPGAGRVGGLFRLDPTVLAREVELAGGLDAPVEARAVLVEAVVGRRAPVALVVVVVGRRGGTPSLLAEAALDAILRRTEDVGVEGAGSFFRSGLAGGGGVLERASWSLAGVGTAMITLEMIGFRDRPYKCSP